MLLLHVLYYIFPSTFQQRKKKKETANKTDSTMAGPTTEADTILNDTLLTILRDLTDDEFDSFKWNLRNIKKSQQARS
ncbi:hypothetical protein PFLUV_G00184660 [Perca fluviatilis]|uniref:Pyrin domain-containing protein n=1 Tax=Perca fluviatilis TaxID=8168 RepID=A0A6A5EMJ8_PERFL|nr:hypothetical protein PFLUV_G00184660 [Perca fluviatilis]